MVLTTTALLVQERHLTILGRSGEATAGLLMGAMTIADALLTPFAGRAGDRYRAHGKVAAISILLLIPGLLWVGFSQGFGGIALGMAVIGAASAGLGPSLLVLMGRLVSAERRGTATGLLQLVGDLGATLGPLVGTALFAGSTAVPYLVTAGLVLCSLPLARLLVRAEVRAAAPP
jgi:MFS family permease